MSTAARPSARREQPAGRTRAEPPKLLRACVVQQGKVVDERRVESRGSVSLGHGPRNTFVIPEPSLPRTHRLFEYRSGHYELILTESMRGRISVDDNVVDFASLKAQGLLKKRGDYYYLPLSEAQRGKVVIGEVTVIFQFVRPPPAPVKPQLPVAARGSVLKSLDWTFMGTLLVCLGIEIPAGIYFQYAPGPPEVTLDELATTRWAKLIVPEMKPAEKKVETAKTKAAGSEGQAKAAKQAANKEPGDEASAAKAKAARRAEIRNNIAGRGVLAILGAAGAGAGGSAVADVFGSGGLGGDIASAFTGISGVGLATGGARTTRGGGSGDAATIGGLATAGGGKVGLGGKQEARVGSITTDAPEVDGALNSDEVARVVAMRKRMLQDCYERELKRDPTLSGKIEVQFTIDERGAVQDARVATNTMGSSAVGECIVSRLRHWRFPAPAGGSVTVTFPFIFTPAG